MCWHPLETDVRFAGDQLVHYRPDCGAVPRSELVEPCGTPADVVQHHRVFTKAGDTPQEESVGTDMQEFTKARIKTD